MCRRERPSSRRLTTQAAPGFFPGDRGADLAVEALGKAVDLQDARSGWWSRSKRHARELSRVADGLAAQARCDFGGLDFTLAPFPEELVLLRDAPWNAWVFPRWVARLAGGGGLPGGSPRSGPEFRRAGFNGLMLPVLEDFTLAKRAAEGTCE